MDTEGHLYRGANNISASRAGVTTGIDDAERTLITTLAILPAPFTSTTILK
jgi:hypothetical protein